VSARRGSLTLTRLFVKGAPPRDFRQRYLKAIRLRTFVPLKVDDENVESSGWCVMERPFELEFDAGNVYEDQLLVLGLRVDRFRIPAALIRSQLIQDEQRLLAQSGKNRVSRNERLELREKIVLKLRKKFAPSTRVLDMVWDLDAGVVMFFTHSRRTLADFAALFEKTFGLELEEDSPYLAASRGGIPESLVRRLTDVEPVRLAKGGRPEATRPVRGAAPAVGAAAKSKTASKSSAETAEDQDEDELLPRIETTRFLGPEFLLWIWLRAELVNGGIALDDDEPYEVWLDRSLTLESPLDRNERVTIRGAAPADGDEAREAVRSRKFPVRSQITLRNPTREFSLALEAPHFAIAGAKVPAVLKTEASEAFVDRMVLAQELFAKLDRLYGAFLRERLSELWNGAWEPAIWAWLAQESPPANILAELASKPPAQKKRVPGARRAR
jgi:recombination associated protein RdgC